MRRRALFRRLVPLNDKRCSLGQQFDGVDILLLGLARTLVVDCDGAQDLVRDRADRERPASANTVLLRKRAIGLPERLGHHVLYQDPLAGERDLAARRVRWPDLEPIDSARIMRGHPGTETQPPRILINNV